MSETETHRYTILDIIQQQDSTERGKEEGDKFTEYALAAGPDYFNRAVSTGYTHVQWLALQQVYKAQLGWRAAMRDFERSLR